MRSAAAMSRWRSSRGNDTRVSGKGQRAGALPWKRRRIPSGSSKPPDVGRDRVSGPLQLASRCPGSVRLWATSPHVGRTDLFRCVQFSKKIRDHRTQRRQILVNRLPHHLQVDAEVVMDQYVAHTGDVAPRDAGTAIAHGGGRLPGCFPDDLKGSDHGQGFLAVGTENLEVDSLRELLRHDDVVKYVTQVVVIRAGRHHTGTTCSRICRPMAGLSARLITRSTFTPSKSLRWYWRSMNSSSVGVSSYSTRMSRSLAAHCSSRNVGVEETQSAHTVALAHLGQVGTELVQQVCELLGSLGFTHSAPLDSSLAHVERPDKR